MIWRERHGASSTPDANRIGVADESTSTPSSSFARQKQNEEEERGRTSASLRAASASFVGSGAPSRRPPDNATGGGHAVGHRDAGGVIVQIKGLDARRCRLALGSFVDETAGTRFASTKMRIDGTDSDVRCRFSSNHDRRRQRRRERAEIEGGRANERRRERS